MRSVFVALILFSSVAISENRPSGSFESNYLALEKKITSLKEKGQKVSEETLKELDALLVQMNHEHTELKRELEKKDQQLKGAVSEVKETKEDWSERVKSAYHEIEDGTKKAWAKLKKDAPPGQN